MKKIQKGFTLIELMIVVAIIGILAAVAIPAYQDYIVKSKLTKVTSTLDPIKTALAMYYQEQGSFPDLSETLANNTTGTPPSTSIWYSLGFSSYPTLPPEVSQLAYVPFGSATAPATGAASFGMILTLAKIKALTIDGQLVGISPSNDMKVTGATAGSSSSGTVFGGSAIQWFYSCHKATTKDVDPIVTKYFNNSGASLVCA